MLPFGTRIFSPPPPPRIGSSDHWSFWKQGYPSLMVADTAIHRNENYHKATDTVDTLDYGSMAKVVAGLGAVVEDLADSENLSLPGREERAPGAP
ncbi:MAG: M28 family peptidase [Phycisphaerales bacterium]